MSADQMQHSGAIALENVSGDMDISLEEMTCDQGDVSGTSNGNDWAELVPEALAEIFSRLPFEDRLRVVPQVCKSWNEASYNPACWVVVDMEPWLYKKTKEDFLWVLYCECKVDHLIKAVVDRSCGQLRELRTMHVSSTVVDYIAERCPGITFHPMSNCSIRVPSQLALNLDTGSLESQLLLLQEEELEAMSVLKLGKRAKLISCPGEGGGREFRSVGSDLKDSASAAAAIAGPMYQSEDSSSLKQGNIIGAGADVNQGPLAQLQGFLMEDDAPDAGTSNWQPHGSKHQQQSLHDQQQMMRKLSAVTWRSKPRDEALTFEQIFQQSPPRPAVGGWGSSNRWQPVVWTNTQRRPTTSSNCEPHDSKQSQQSRFLHQQMMSANRPLHNSLTFDEIFEQSPGSLKPW